MKFTVLRDTLLGPLQSVASVVERRQTLPILSNLLLNVTNDQLSLTGTDLEVEIIGRVALEGVEQTGQTTVPARKLFDICRSLPEGALISFSEEKQRVTVKSSGAKFVLSTLPASDYPHIEEGKGQIEFSIEQKDLHYLFKQTQFAMAQQDVRRYLNGMLLELSADMLRAVATDGHRLATSTVPFIDNSNETTPTRVIIPRKGIVELMRLLNQPNEKVTVTIGDNHIQMISQHFTFISKLVDGGYPDTKNLLPRSDGKSVLIEKAVLQQALSRVLILSNELLRGVYLQFNSGTLRLWSTNPEQEEAEETVDIQYSGEEFNSAFNITYLLDVLNVLAESQVNLTFPENAKGVVIEEASEGRTALYVVMPVKL